MSDDAEPGTRPWQDRFSIRSVEIVAETPELRVLHMTFDAGERVPWHWHTTIVDRFYCLEGAIEIESRAPRAMHRLKPGETCAVDPKVAHEVRNIAPGASRLLAVQGVGRYDYHAVGGEHGEPPGD